MNDLFYGSAVVSGDVGIRGPLNDINLNITATTNGGTNMFIPLNNSSYVSENDFIVFVSEKILELVKMQKLNCQSLHKILI